MEQSICSYAPYGFVRNIFLAGARLCNCRAPIFEICWIILSTSSFKLDRLCLLVCKNYLTPSNSSNICLRAPGMLTVTFNLAQHRLSGPYSIFRTSWKLLATLQRLVFSTANYLFFYVIHCVQGSADLQSMPLTQNQRYRGWRLKKIFKGLIQTTFALTLSAMELTMR